MVFYWIVVFFDLGFLEFRHVHWARQDVQTDAVFCGFIGVFLQIQSENCIKVL